MPDTIDLNSATAEQLSGLPGVDDELARRIVAHRQEHGPFRSYDELRDIDGINVDILELIRKNTHLGEAPDPAPRRESLRVRLVRPGDGDGDDDFVGHAASIAGVRTGLGADLPSAPFLAFAPTDADGLAVAEVPARASLVGNVTIRISGPDGGLLKATEQDGPTLPEEVRIELAPVPRSTPLPNTDPAAGRPTKVRGRVIDSAGRRQAAGLQVVLWGATTDAPQPADFRALVVAVTDAQGHFTGPYPIEEFTAAHASVGGDDRATDVPVHLDDKEFPETVVLVIDVPEPVDDADCGCHDTSAPRSPDAADLARADGTFSADVGGRCVDFTKPDRTLEEYAYTYLVRTTEPQIKGLTLDEPRKVPLDKLAPFIRAEVAQALRPVQSSRVSGAVPGTGFAAEAVSGLRSSGPVSEQVLAGLGTPPDSPETSSESRAARTLEALDFAPSHLDAAVLSRLATKPTASPLRSVYLAGELTRHGNLLRYLGAAVARPPGRQDLTGSTPMDWDEDPTVYQAATVAHGHVLRFKQEWVADGYSLGSLLYSLPLAPGQKKQVAIVDWERREAAARSEERVATEDLSAELTRDRDVSEIVGATLRESTRGGSSASSGSVAGGIGVGAILGPVGGLIGVGGGHSSANSSSWQTSSRQTAANALQQLRDRTSQAASSVRTQRTSVVQSASQGERIAVTTEAVANYNHCHALTIQYFEVLRHLLVRERLVDVQECLLVPLLMSWFTDDKALRWRSTLASAVPGHLRGGFAALDRIDADYAGSDLPVGRYADDNLEAVEGDLNLRFQLARPRDKNDEFDAAAWNPLLKLFGFSPEDFYKQFLKDSGFKDRVFIEQLGPKIAANVIQLLRVHAVKEDGSAVDLRIDPTLVSNFVNDRSLYVSLRMSAALPPVRRSDIKAVVVSAKLRLPGLDLILDVLPAGSRVIVESGALRYRTAHLSGSLFSSSTIRNDLTGTDDVRIETPLTRQELRNPRNEDRELARNLLDHLNENIEQFHHLLWSRMSDARRFMLLDGFIAPNSGGRSVASVVENELIGVVGNSLVLPVARGFHLDPTFKQDVENPVDLLEHYQPNTPIEPSRVAVPTSGVFAEAVMGSCNSCEVIDETRFWRWEEHPVPDSPASIVSPTTDSRRSEPLDTTPTDFPAQIVAMQQAPAAPDPTGLSAAMQLLGKSDLFRDAAGLQGTQQNAAKALEQAFTTATTMGTKAADLALQGKMTKDIDKAMKTIQAAKDNKLIDDKQAADLTSTAIRGLIGAGTTNPEKASSQADVKDLTKTAGDNKAAVEVTRPTGEQVKVDARPVMPGSSPPVDAGVPPRPAGIDEAPIDIDLVNPGQSISAFGGAPLAVRIKIPDLSAINADTVKLQISDGTLTSVYDVTLPSSLLTDGSYTWQWDGRNNSGIFDATVLSRQLALILTFESAGTVTGIRQKHLRTSTARTWTASRIDDAAKKIETYVYLDCQNEDNLPAADFHKLRDLVLSGIGKYWSRTVTLNATSYAVSVVAQQRASFSEDIDLYIETGTDYRRSHNSGLIDASIFYNKGFYGGINAKADADFEETAAHEFGHSVLWAAGGKELSWGHKGTVNHSLLSFWNFQDLSPAATNYPATGEIDLMKYYKGAQPADFYSRVKAAEEDVRRLMGLSSVTFWFL